VERPQLGPIGQLNVAAMTGQFLSNPTDIRRAVGWLAERSNQMDLAVGFVGRDWRDALANFRGKLRILCWLSSTNTDPRAVRQLMARNKTEVRQRDGMHAKVYIAPHFGVIVGSANLSARALAEFEQNGRDEAGVLLKDRANRSAVSKWFRTIWRAKGTRSVTDDDLSRALLAFRKAHRNRRGAPEGRQKRGASKIELTRLKKRQELEPIARHIRGINIVKLGWLRTVNVEKITKSTLIDIVDEFEGWMKRRFLFEQAFLNHDIGRVREALVDLFDESEDVAVRLERLTESGALDPLRINTISLLLYWRTPHKYPPFNRRTKRFLKDFRLGKRGISDASPTTYRRWLDYAEQLSQELKLPTPGHIDRLVWRYTDAIDF
jgi:hypothetical protein